MSIEKIYENIDMKFDNMSLEELDDYELNTENRIAEIGIDAFIDELKDSYNA